MLMIRSTAVASLEYRNTSEAEADVRGSRFSLPNGMRIFFNYCLKFLCIIVVRHM